MSFIRNALKSTGLVSFDEEAVTPPVQPKSEQVHEQPSQRTSTTPARTVTRRGAVAVDEDMRKQIISDVDANTPADLAIFYENVAAFEQISDDEATRYKSAYISFSKATKKTVTDILSAMETRVGALDSTIESFQKEAETETAAIAKLRKQTDELDEQIAELQSKKQDVMIEAAGREKNLSDSQTTFMVTTDAIKAELAEEQTKLTTYLPANGTTSARTTKRKER